MSANDPVDETSYPAHWEADVVLRDGTTTHVRPIRPTDRDALQDFHMGQSERSTYMRFFAAMERLSENDLTRFTQVDMVDRVAVVATTMREGAEAIIGVARFDRLEHGDAEVAFNISDSAQGRGLGSVLLEHIAAAARERGIRRFFADVLPQNGRMLSVFREAGYRQVQHEEDGIVEVTVDLDPTEHSLRVMAEREHRAESVSMRRLFSPQRILVVASLTDEPTPEELRLAKGALASGIGVKGDEPVYVLGMSPVQIRDAQERHGLHDNFVHFASLAQLLDSGLTFDIAILAVSDTAVAPLLSELSEIGVHGVVLLASGFAETGRHGLALQREAIRIAHSSGIRIIGPASYGLFSNTAQPPFNASLAPTRPKNGTIGLFTQSTAIAVALLSIANRRRLGISNFLAAGNRADVSGNDMMQFWLTDNESTSVGLYLESIGNPRKFSRIARRLSRRKPIVVVTAGKSGYVVPRGHAVSPTEAPKKTLEQMLKQSGVIHARNMHEMADVLQFFAYQPIPQGRRLGILASSEALAAIAAEAAQSAGLTVTDQVHVVRSMEIENNLQGALESLYSSGQCDIALIAHVPTLGEFPIEAATQVALAAAQSQIPTVASVLGLHGIAPELTISISDEPGGSNDTTTSSRGTRAFSVPAYSTPEDAVRALEHVTGYVAWLEEDHGSVVYFDGIDKHRVEDLLKGAPNGLLNQEDTATVLAAYGIKLWPVGRAHTPEEACALAEQFGYPIALKSTAAALRHRYDLGGVRLNIASSEELVQDFDEMVNDLERHLGSREYVISQGFDIQAMAPSGVPCVVRSQEDPLYGPVIAFGLSGDAFDLLDDIAYGIPPLTATDISQMVRSVKASPKLFGYKGLPLADVASLEELIARVSLLSDNHPRIRELELYPVIVADSGAAVVSARLTLGEGQRKDGLRRAMTSAN